MLLSKLHEPIQLKTVEIDTNVSERNILDEDIGVIHKKPKTVDELQSLLDVAKISGLAVDHNGQPVVTGTNLNIMFPTAGKLPFSALIEQSTKVLIGEKTKIVSLQNFAVSGSTSGISLVIKSPKFRTLQDCPAFVTIEVHNALIQNLEGLPVCFQLSVNNCQELQNLDELEGRHNISVSAFKVGPTFKLSSKLSVASLTFDDTILNINAPYLALVSGLSTVTILGEGPKVDTIRAVLELRKSNASNNQKLVAALRILNEYASEHDPEMTFEL